MSKVGFIGLGRMGAGMARRLLGSVDTLLVHDIDAQAVHAITAEGATALPDTASMGAAADIVFVSLPTPDIVRDVVLGADGLLASRRPRVIVDLSTSGPRLACELHAALTLAGIASFDAPVSGGVKGAHEGTLSLMVSGPMAQWGEVEPLLARFGKPFYMGEQPGAGQTMKLINNLLGAVAIAVTSEGLAMGIKAGLDPARVIDVLNQSTGRNSATQDKWPRAVLPRSFDFGFATGLSLKDVRLCAEEAAALGVPLKVGGAMLDILERTAATYGEDSDFTAMAKIVEQDSGMNPDRGPDDDWARPGPVTRRSA